MQSMLQFTEQGNDLFLGHIALVAFTVEARFVGLANSQNTGYPFRGAARAV
jgi:hypothetical protein